MVESAGLAARVLGMWHYCARLLCRGGKARLVEALASGTVLAEADFPWAFGETCELSLEAVGAGLRAWIDGRRLFEMEDAGRSPAGGAVALVCEEGRTATQAVAFSAL